MENNDPSKPILDGDDDFDMEELLTEFAEEEKDKNEVFQLSDSEGELDSLLEEFATVQSGSADDKSRKGNAKVILSSDDEEIDDLLEEFGEVNSVGSDESGKQNADLCSDKDVADSIVVVESDTRNGTVFDSAFEILVSDENKDVNDNMAVTNKVDNSSNLSHPVSDFSLKEQSSENKITTAVMDNSEESVSYINQFSHSQCSQDLTSANKSHADSEQSKSVNYSERGGIVKTSFLADVTEMQKLKSESKNELMHHNKDELLSSSKTNVLSNGIDSPIVCNNGKTFSTSSKSLDSLGRFVNSFSDHHRTKDSTSQYLSFSRLLIDDRPLPSAKKSLESSSTLLKSSYEPNHVADTSQSLSANNLGIKIMTVETVPDSESWTDNQVSSPKITSNVSETDSVMGVDVNDIDSETFVAMPMSDYLSTSSASFYERNGIEGLVDSSQISLVASSMKDSDCVAQLDYNDNTTKGLGTTVYDNLQKDKTENTVSCAENVVDLSDRVAVKENQDKYEENYKTSLGACEIKNGAYFRGNINALSIPNESEKNNCNKENMPSIEVKESSKFVPVMKNISEKEGLLHLNNKSSSLEEMLSVTELVESIDKSVEEASKCNGYKSMLTEFKKRKISIMDWERDRKKKKHGHGSGLIKNDVTSELIPGMKDFNLANKIKEVIPWEWDPSKNVRVQKTVLDKVALHVLEKIVDENFPEEVSRANTVIKELKDHIEEKNKVISFYQSKRKELRLSQKEEFARKHYVKKSTRTVGINVRIIKIKDPPAVKKEVLTPLHGNGSSDKKNHVTVSLPKMESQNDLSVKKKQESVSLPKKETPKLAVNGMKTIPKSANEEIAPLDILLPKFVKNGDRLIPFLNPTKHVSQSSPTNVTTTLSNVSHDKSHEMLPPNNTVVLKDPGSLTKDVIEKMGLNNLPDDTNIVLPLNQLVQLLSEPKNQSSEPKKSPVLPDKTVAPCITSSATIPVTQVVFQQSEPHVRGIPPGLQLQRMKLIHRSAVPSSTPPGPFNASSFLNNLARQTAPSPRQMLRPPLSIRKVNPSQPQQGPVVTMNYPSHSLQQPSATEHYPMWHSNLQSISVHNSPISTHHPSSSGCDRSSFVNHRPPSMPYPTLRHIVHNPSIKFPPPPYMRHPALPQSLIPPYHSMSPLSYPAHSKNHPLPFEQMYPVPQPQPHFMATNNHSLFSSSQTPAQFHHFHHMATSNSNQFHRMASSSPSQLHQMSSSSPSFATTVYPSKESSMMPATKLTEVVASHFIKSASSPVSSVRTVPVLPEKPSYNDCNFKPLLPRPDLKVARKDNDVMLSWNIALSEKSDNLSCYQIYSCHVKKKDVLGAPLAWKKVGDIAAMPLPMACTLRQFEENNSYHFIIRAVDNMKQLGPFSDVASVYF